ncbi:hypothetical protein CEXT_670421 [Caerostris extrusa]|uniref:Uncharacterized protein n=1 Tax=Caerostris extrusa TaxID=172846 RepID=A0AAV4PIN2_CAEEX|nr:hypothetical protein CEXT_670421 [Caerostris extrusa]
MPQHVLKGGGREADDTSVNNVSDRTRLDSIFPVSFFGLGVLMTKAFDPEVAEVFENMLGILSWRVYRLLIDPLLGVDVTSAAVAVTHLTGDVLLAN